MWCQKNKQDKLICDCTLLMKPYLDTSFVLIAWHQPSCLIPCLLAFIHCLKALFTARRLGLSTNRSGNDMITSFPEYDSEGAWDTGAAAVPPLHLLKAMEESTASPLVLLPLAP